MELWKVALLAVIQGFAELLPVSSSAHVILAQHWMGVDPSSPEMTFLLVMLHSGTMVAVLMHYWKRWKQRFNRTTWASMGKNLIAATFFTGVLGLSLKFFIEKVIGFGEVENLFRVLPLVGCALVAVSFLIIFSGRRQRDSVRDDINLKDSIIIGLVQGLALPFRGFSRSGATISTGILRGISMAAAEEFSFALAVILTPPVVILQIRRLIKSLQVHPSENLSAVVWTSMQPGLIGFVLATIAGLFALKWLSRWLELGRWQYFGYYCLVLAALVFYSAASS